MTEGNAVAAAVAALLRTHGEDVVAFEVVTELTAPRHRRRGGGGGGGAKLRGLALCQRGRAYNTRNSRTTTAAAAAAAAAASATLYLLSVEQKAQQQQQQVQSSSSASSAHATRGVRVRIRRVIAVDRLVDVTHDGSFDANLHAGAGGVLSVSFASHIQREIFLAALQRLRSGGGGGGGTGGSGNDNNNGDDDVVAVLTQTAAATAGSRIGGSNNSYSNRGGGDGGAVTAVMSSALTPPAAHVRRGQPSRRDVYTAAEEQQLLRAMRGGSLDDVRQFQAVLLAQQKDAELSSVDYLVSCDAAWAATRRQVQERIHDVEDVEARIAQYAHHLLTKKDVIQQIEHDNNTLQQKQRNLEQLYRRVVGLREQLSLDEDAARVMRRLAAIAPDDAAALTAFFTEDNGDGGGGGGTTTAAVLSRAMQHMQRVLRNRHLETDYAIAAVAQRRAFFVAQRRLIAQRAHVYALSTIAAYEQRNLAACARGRGGAAGDGVVWQLHSELHARLRAVAMMLRALARLDVEAHTRVLRRYRASMQCVFALEIHRFFKQLRAHVRTVDASGDDCGGDDDEGRALLMGASTRRDAALSLRRVTASMTSAATTTAASPSSSSPLVPFTAHATPRLWRGGEYGSAAVSPSPMLPSTTPMTLSQQQQQQQQVASDNDGNNSNSMAMTATAVSAASRRLRIVLPSTVGLRGSVELYADPNTLRGVRALARTSSSSSWLASLRRSRSRSTSRDKQQPPSYNNNNNNNNSNSCGRHEIDGDGRLRPDLAVAMALQASVTVVLHEEALLSQCFGLYNKSSTGSGSSGDDDDDKDDESGSGSSDDDGDNDMGGGEDADKREARLQRRRQRQQQTQLLLRESLLELFGGNADTTATLLAQLHDASVRAQPPLYPTRRATVTATATSAAATGADDNSCDNVAPLTAAADTRALALQAEQQQQQQLLLPSSSATYTRSYLADELASFLAFVFDKCDRLYALPVLCMVRAYRGHDNNSDSGDGGNSGSGSNGTASAPLLPTRSAFCREMLQPCAAVATAAMARFVAEQTASITRCKNRYFVRPTALLPCFVHLPRLFARLDVAYGGLATAVCDRASTYAVIATSLVDQCFAALEYSTDGSHAEEATHNAGLSLPELFLRKLNATLDGVGGTKHSSFTRTVVQQLRHHAFFCVFYAALPQDSYAAQLLADYHTASQSRRERSEALYLTRVLLLHDFPLFGAFALAAEDLAQVYTQDELRLHRVVAPEAVRQVLARLPKELRAGVRASAQRMRTHLLRDVVLPSGTRHSSRHHVHLHDTDSSHNTNVALDGDGEAAFHCTLLQCTWRHFSQLLLRKYDFVAQLLTFAMYDGMSMPLSRNDLVVMLAAY